MLNGVINVRKEKGYTSHDAVNRLRRVLGQKKIGHTGTLDPGAEGVLPVCLGAGTKLCDMFTDTGKEYVAVLLLGVTTDTQDTSGQVLSSKEVHATEEEVRETILSFIGTYEQLPPMYSAVKVNGRKLYEFARRGIEVERSPRKVTIDDIVINEIALPRIRMTVSCSKGTYIRTLCEDIGSRLGTGGCMESLLRSRVGSFKLEDALTIGQISELAEKGTVGDVVISIDVMFPDAAGAHVGEEDDLYLHNGNPLRKQDLYLQEGEQYTDKMRVYDSAGVFMGLYRWDERKKLYKPEKMFLPL